MERLSHVGTIAADAAADALLVFDPDGLAAYCNPAAERLFGPAASILGRPLSALIRHTNPDQAAGRPIRTLGVRSDGAEFSIEVCLSHRETPDGRYLAGVVREIGPAADASGTVQEEEERLRQSAKLEAVGLLAGGIAHDFNNILTAIFGFSKLLLDGLPEGEQRENVLEIRDATERAAGLARQLLAFSRQQKVNAVPLDANDLLSKLHNMLSRLLPETIALELRLAGNLPHIVADRTQLEQVVLNLAVNGRDAMPDGGRLLIETALVNLEAAAHQGAKSGPHVMIAIADSGVGMDADTRARIFEPFFTTKGRHGTGLGLSTVYGIVHQSGGSLTVDSVPGQGSTFRVYFPAISVQAPADPPVPAAGAGGDETILIVEDDEVIRRSLAKVLRQHGYSVLEAGSAAEALMLHPDVLSDASVLLSDIVLPDRDGLELADALRARYPGLRALFMSGYAETAVFELGAHGDRTEFLHKPFAPAVLVQRLRQLMAK